MSGNYFSCYQHGSNYFPLVWNRHITKGNDVQWMVYRNQHIVAALHLVVSKSQAKPTSSFLMFQIHQFFVLSQEVYFQCHEVCHSSKLYLLIDGLKLENGILKEKIKEVQMKAMFLLADLPSHSLEWLGIQQRTISLFAKSSWYFLNISEPVDCWTGMVHSF